MNVLVIIPARNEAESLPGVVADLRERHPHFRILVVDDGSTDETPSVVEHLPVDWLRLGSTVGVGGAMRAGFRYAEAKGFDTVVRIDGDGQHGAESVGALIAPLVDGRADVVCGSRYLAASGHRASGFRRLAQRVVGWMIWIVTGEPVSDPTSGFWAFGPRTIRLLARHHPASYPEPELLLLLHRNRLRTCEVAVQMRERTGGTTSLTAARTMLAIARVLLALLVVPLRPVIEPSHD